MLAKSGVLLPDMEPNGRQRQAAKPGPQTMSASLRLGPGGLPLVFRLSDESGATTEPLRLTTLPRICLWLRAPWGGQQELDGLCLDQWTELNRERHEVLVREEPLPEVSSIFVTGEAPEMDELMKLASVRSEVADQILGEATCVKSRPAKCRVQTNHL